MVPPTLQNVLDSLHEIPALFEPVASEDKNGKKIKKNPGWIDFGTAIENLKKVIENLTKIMERDHKQMDDLKKEHIEKDEALKARVRVNEDQVDHQKQRNLRGKFLITSKAQENKEALIEPEKKGLELVSHVKSLASKKYGVDIKEQEISSCYYTKSGGIILSLWDQGPASSFQNIVQIIKSNKSKKEVNVFFNFMLTRRRSALLFDVRQLKKEGKIEKFWSDEEGNISVQVVGKKDKKRITNFFDPKIDDFKTLYINELVLQ